MKKIYLAIPYTGMQESSYRQANVASVCILNMGHNVFSPITHSHPLTDLKHLSVPHTWEFWQDIDYQFIDWSNEVWVLLPEEGLNKVHMSTGVQAEIKYAQQTNKTVRTITIRDENVVFLDPLLSLKTNVHASG